MDRIILHTSSDILVVYLIFVLVIINPHSNRFLNISYSCLKSFYLIIVVGYCQILILVVNQL